MKLRTEKLVDLQDWDELVQETYGRPYSLPQQGGCRERGTFPLTVPAGDDDYRRDEIPEVVNGDERGVSFAAWLKRDPKTKLPGQTASYELDLFWERSFYPDVQMVANDLHAKGLLEAGEYLILIDW